MARDFRLDKLYTTINEKVFDNELPIIQPGVFRIVTNKRMTRIWGNCKYRYFPTRTKPRHEIAIMHRIAKFYGNLPDSQLVCTLVHEMCHLYFDIKDGNSNEAHGLRWKKEFAFRARIFDLMFDVDFVSAYAQRQVNTQFASKTPQRTRVAAERSRSKWTLTCPTCGFIRHAGRLGSTMKLACVGSGRVIHQKEDGTECKEQLNATKNW
jgi:hypothetical protein